MRKWWYCLVLSLCIWMIACFADQSFAQAEEHIFNQNEMYRLLFEGFDWNNIIVASVLTYTYQIPLETILKLQPENCDWTTFEESIKGMSEARQMVKGTIPANAEIQKLKQAGFSEKEIAYIAFQSHHKKEKLKDSADQWVIRKDKKHANSELAQADTLSLTVDSAYIINATETIEDPGYEYNIAKCTPYRAVLENGNESISPSSGFLQITETDLSLPGRNGLDFHLARVYDNSEAKLLKPAWGINNNVTAVTDIYGIGNGWKWDFPRLETAGESFRFLSGGKVKTFHKVLLNGGHYYTSEIKDYTFGYAMGTSYTYVVKHNSGVNYYFNSDKRLRLIKNRYGDTIQFDWDGDHLIKVTDSVKRIITFNYTSELTTVTLVSNSTPYQIKYYKRKQTEIPFQGQYELYQVELPEQTFLQYEYKVQAAAFDFSWAAFPGQIAYLNLVSKTNPMGGKTCYGYETYRRSSTAGTFEDYYKVNYRYDLNNETPQNNTCFVYENHDVKDQDYYTTVFHDITIQVPFKIDWSRKERLTFSKDHTNTRTITEIADQPGYKETKTIAYYRQLPEYVTITKTNSNQPGTSVSFRTDYNYDQYGNVIRFRDSGGAKPGHYQVSKYTRKFLQNQEFIVQETNWIRERVGIDDQWNFIEQRYDYDTNENVTTTTVQEYTGSRQIVTENIPLSTGELTQQSPVSFVHLPEGSSRVEIRFSHSFYSGLYVKYWEEGATRPEDDSSDPISASPYIITLNPDKDYILELKIAPDRRNPEENPYVYPEIIVTYNKLMFKSEAIKTTTHNHYASPATLGLPDYVHVEYGNGGATHSTSFGADSCIVTRYEYNATVDNPVSAENYANVFPSKVIKYVRGVDQTANQAAHQEITDVRYNRFGNITQLKQYGIQNGTTSEILTNDYTYDGLNRLTSEIYRSSKLPNEHLKKTYFYSKTPDTNGLFYTEITHQDEARNGISDHVTRFYYDKLGRYVKTTKGASSPITVEKVTYDANGRKESIEDGVGVQTTFQYDGYGREKKISSKDKTGVEKAYKEIIYNDVAQTVTENVYDLTGTTKTLKGKAVKQYNAYGQLVQVDQYPQLSNQSVVYSTKYTYDLQNQIVSTVDPSEKTLKYEYDYFGVKKVDYPGPEYLRSDDVYVYNYLDRTKEVKKQVAMNSYIITEYDELDRVRKITYPEGRVTRYYYDGAGRLAKTTDTSSTQNSEIVYEHDLTGNIKKARHTYDGNVFEVEYGFDEKGNVTSITYPGGYSVSYEYDQYGRVIRVPQFIEGVPITTPDPVYPPKPDPKDPIIDDPNPIDLTGVSFTPLATTQTPGVKYKANGFMEELRYVNGITTTFTDDSLGRIRTIKNLVFELTYGYDCKGNVTSIIGSNGVSVVASYSYYDNDWLKTATQGQNLYAYVYDPAGNCTTKTINGVQTSYTYDEQSLNLLTAVNGMSITHDTKGNMKGRIDTGCGYTYDQSNQLTMIMKNGQDVGRYFYNSEGKRYKKVENGNSTYYVYGGESLLYELKSDGTAVSYIYLSGKQIAKVERKNGVDKKFFYHTDHLGSTRAITDEQGNVVERFEYQPFGLEEPTTTGDDTLTYTGKMQDDPTGLMYFNARYYDPMLGRFINEDFAKDGSNWFVYAGNNPLRYVDPNGLKKVDARLLAAEWAVKQYNNPDTHWGWSYEGTVKVTKYIIGGKNSWKCNLFVGGAYLLGGGLKLGVGYPALKKGSNQFPKAQYLVNPNNYKEYFDTPYSSSFKLDSKSVKLKAGDIIAFDYGYGEVGHNLIVGSDGKIYAASEKGIRCFDTFEDVYNEYGLSDIEWSVRRLKDEKVKYDDGN